MTVSKLDEALMSPYKRMKDVDREVEFLPTDELLKKKRALTKGRGLFKQFTIKRDRGL